MFWVTEEEKDQILEQMSRYGTENMSAYLRKIAIDGQVINLQIPELSRISTQLQYLGNNVNQVAIRVNSGGPLYREDLNYIREAHDELCQALRGVLEKISTL